jgi:hypothetical protein
VDSAEQPFFYQHLPEKLEGIGSSEEPLGGPSHVRFFRSGTARRDRMQDSVERIRVAA